MSRKKERGSIELVVLGLLAALIVVLALPLFSAPGAKRPGIEPRVAKVVQDAQVVK